jgi:hypothetical protein
MKYVVSILAAALLTTVLAAGLGFGAIRHGRVPPPTGTLRLGALTIMALPPCPAIPGSPLGWGRRCGSASPWAVWAIVRWPDGTNDEWEIVSMTVDP